MNAITNTNVIQKKIELKAPISRVWRALTDYREFSTWFGVDLKDEFAVGKTVSGRINHPGYDHTWDATFKKIEPEHYLSLTWHPCGGDKTIDYSKETPTLVEFQLEQKNGGTLLTVTESGFDNLPSHRRAEAFAGNDAGWTVQLGRISNYLEHGKV